MSNEQQSLELQQPKRIVRTSLSAVRDPIAHFSKIALFSISHRARRNEVTTTLYLWILQVACMRARLHKFHSLRIKKSRIYPQGIQYITARCETDIPQCNATKLMVSWRRMQDHFQGLVVIKGGRHSCYSASIPRMRLKTSSIFIIFFNVAGDSTQTFFVLSRPVVSLDFPTFVFCKYPGEWVALFAFVFNSLRSSYSVTNTSVWFGSWIRLQGKHACLNLSEMLQHMNVTALWSTIFPLILSVFNVTPRPQNLGDGWT